MGEIRSINKLAPLKILLWKVDFTVLGEVQPDLSRKKGEGTVFVWAVDGKAAIREVENTVPIKMKGTKIAGIVGVNIVGVGNVPIRLGMIFNGDHFVSDSDIQDAIDEANREVAEEVMAEEVMAEENDDEELESKE